MPASLACSTRSYVNSRYETTAADAEGKLPLVIESSSLDGHIELLRHRGRPSQESGLHNRRRVRNTGIVRTYGQYCPIARGAETERLASTQLQRSLRGLGGGVEASRAGDPSVFAALRSSRMRNEE